MSERLTVKLPNRSYDIVVGERLLPKAGELIRPLLKNDRVFIITDESVARLYLHRFTSALEDAKIRYRPFILPAGEATKNFDALGKLMEELLEQKPDRNTTLIALGGGVVGDITGFAASILLRGVDFIQVPTTLLAQIDSSVGGKTGVNSKFGKNLIGSFHQPKLVLADMQALTSLPKRELLAGYAEMVKYGLINDAEFFTWLEANSAAMLAPDMALLQQAVIKSCAAKAAIVEQDEKESGVRALLNLGHTFGHALEAEMGYGGELLHGEAVAIGMVMAYEFSAYLGLCPAEDAARAEALLKNTGLRTRPHEVRPNWSTATLMDHFTRDKKASSGKLTFILARAIGQSFIDRDVSTEKLSAYLSEQQGIAA